MKEHALKVFRQPPDRLNCAQSVLHAWHEVIGDTAIKVAELKTSGAGRAPEGLCGALYGACLLAPNRAEELKTAFAARLSSLYCKEIRAAKEHSCTECVAEAAELLDPDKRDQPGAHCGAESKRGEGDDAAAASDPRNFSTVETLNNGVSVTIRAIQPDDKARLVEAFQQLDPESVYNRFFQAKPSLTEQELKAATEVDFNDIVALVATVGDGEGETIIGGGRYLVVERSCTPRSAEIAFLIEEDFHGQGLAGRILKHLATIAREKGVGQFEAMVLPQNKAMLAVFSRCGLPLTQRPADGTIHVTLSLSGLPEPT